MKKEKSLKEKSIPITCFGGRLQLGIPPCPAKKGRNEESTNLCQGEMHSVVYSKNRELVHCFQCSLCNRVFTESYLEGKGLYPFYGLVNRNPFEHQRSRGRDNRRYKREKDSNSHTVDQLSE